MSMGDGVKCPSMSWDTGDDQNAVEEFKMRLERWFVIKGIQDKDRHNYIIFQTGERGEKLADTWKLTAEQLAKSENVWQQLRQSVGTSENFRVHRLTLMGYRQNEDESIDEFHARCRSLAQKCKFQNVEERILDQLVVGTRVAESRREMLKGDEKLTVDEALAICRTQEASEAHMKAFETSKSKKVDSVQKSEFIKDCKFCGRDHVYGRCPAYNARCAHCSKKGHWKECCFDLKGGGEEHSREKDSKTVKKGYKNRPRSHSRTPRGDRFRRHGRNNNRESRKVHSVDVEDHIEDDFERLAFDVITSSENHIDSEDLMVHLDVDMPQGKTADLFCKVDTGAQGNVLPLRTFRKMFPDQLSRDKTPIPGDLVRKKPFVRLDAYNGTEIKQYGVINLKLRYKPLSSNWISAEFFIGDTDGPIILGKKASQQLRIIIVNRVHEVTLKVSQKSSPIPDTQTLMDLYPDRFEGIGNFPGECRIELKSDAEPVVCPPRRYPIHLKGEIQQELDKMQQLGVIEPVPETETTEWLNSLAFSRKESGKLRICLDPRNLNTAVKRTYHRTPTLEEVTHKLAGAKVYSKLDAKHGYWSIRLDLKSSALTAFNGPNGRYRFKRLPFGLKVSQDLFQEKMDTILSGLNGTMNIADDILVFGRDVQDHDRNMHELMKRARTHGLVLNGDKCVVRTDSVNFFGMMFTTNGVKPDSRKAQEIADLPSPKDVRELQQFLGMIQYMAPFIPNLSEKSYVLRELTKKDSEWCWRAEQEKVFCNLKDELCKTVTLNYFDTRKRTKVQVDASGRGLGAALIQLDDRGNESVIAFASKALTPTEQRYANIERELLAVVFGIERFHTFLYGVEFIVESDHKPLEAIQLKQLSQAPPRLQRMLLRIQPYDVTIHYRPGNELKLADGMSRLNPKPGGTIKVEKTIHAVKWSSEKIDRLRKLTSEDPELSILQSIILTGWPEQAQELPKAVRHFWSMKDHLSLENGTVIKGTRIMIPSQMQKEILDILHTSHQGIEKTRLLARTCVYWPNIDKDIMEMVQSCDLCLKYSRSETKESLHPRDVPSGPWEMVGTDLFELNGQNYLIVSDYYSKMPFIRRLQYQTSGAVIAKLKNIFSEHGIPSTLYSDGGPCYSSHAFAAFAEKWGFKHIRSSPHYPQSNGFIERQVQTVKNIMLKSTAEPELALLCARITPIDRQLPSPSQLLYGRNITANLPSQHLGNMDIINALERKQQKQKMYYDKRGVKDQPELSVGKVVGLQNPHTLKWAKGKIIDRCKEPRSYLVHTEDGSCVRRNRSFLRDLGENNNISTSEAPHAKVEEQPNREEGITTDSKPGSPEKKTVTFNEEVQVQPRRSTRTSVKPKRLIETL